MPNTIARITTAGVITEFSVPTGNSHVNGITGGPDGNVWFVEENTNKIGRITPAGVITEFTSPSVGQPFGVTGGPDGNVWYTKGSGFVGRITAAGVITEFPVSAGGWGITTGPDGNLWFANGVQMTRVTTAGESRRTSRRPRVRFS